MPNVKDLKMDERNTRFFVVGGYGTGKSVFAASFPTPGFVFDFDNGIETYRGGDWDYETYSMDRTGWIQFEKDLKRIREEIGKYKTIVVDSTTAMTALAMEQALFLDPKRSATGGPLWNVHFQMTKNLMEGKLRQLTNLPCNIVVIAHMQVIQDMESGAIVDIKPLLTGQLADIVPGYFSEVLYATTQRKEGKTQWLLQTVSIGLKRARSRLSGVEHRLQDFVPNDYNEFMKQLTTTQPKGKTNA